jgi:FkbM family methyltransferase
MKTIQYKGMDWAWNSIDEKLLHVNDWVRDLNAALKHVKRTGLAVQAGGAMGIWPVELSGRFGRVFTFEAEEENFKCLKHNTRLFNNIYAHHCALGAVEGIAETRLPPSESNNAGAFYTMPVEGSPQRAADGSEAPWVPVKTLDSLILEQVDFLQLDVEGRELDVLKGAERIIDEYHPVIMVEEKPLPQDHETGHVVGAVEKFLGRRGYKIVERLHRDLVFA